MTETGAEIGEQIIDTVPVEVKPGKVIHMVKPPSENIAYTPKARIKPILPPPTGTIVNKKA